ncbi:MAG: gliding motility protein GldM, partial [Cytophagales bacterium]
MAGGKETPRQKMIGMMYLVLTALLALNVSNAVLEKFAIIDSTLSDFLLESDKKNASTLAGIQNSKADATLVKEQGAKAQKVRDLAKKTVADLEEFKKKMKTEPDGKAIEGEELVLNTVRAEELMLDSKKPEVGQSYEKTINA